MTTIVFVRRFLVDHARNPVHLMLLVVVPTAFRLRVASRRAGFADLLGGAGWPAGCCS